MKNEKRLIYIKAEVFFKELPMLNGFPMFFHFDLYGLIPIKFVSVVKVFTQVCLLIFLYNL